MENPLISVVLPIYNVKQFLDRAVDSVVKQTYKNLEIILVDDGSTDGCYDLAENWAKKDGRIKVVHKENAGLGYARNTGIEKATGEYICFFDSDDYVLPETIEKAYQNAKVTNADLVFFGHKQQSKKGKILTVVQPRLASYSYVGEQIKNDFMPLIFAIDKNSGKDYGLWLSSWMMLFSLKLIKESGWKFVSERDIISEDVYSLCDLLGYANKVSILSEPLYVYCQNPTSLTRTYKKDRYDKIKDFYVKLVELCKDKGYTEQFILTLPYPFISFTVSALKNIAILEKNKKQRKEEIYKIITDDFFVDIMNNCNLQYRSKYQKILFNLIKKGKLKTAYFFIILWSKLKG